MDVAAFGCSASAGVSVTATLSGVSAVPAESGCLATTALTLLGDNAAACACTTDCRAASCADCWTLPIYRYTPAAAAAPSNKASRMRGPRRPDFGIEFMLLHLVEKSNDQTSY